MRNIDYASKQLENINKRISTAAHQASRDASNIQLIGASKRQPAKKIELFHEAGLQAVGENFVQEALDKKDRLSALDLDWHYIGHIQSNKTQSIAHNFTWVHGIDRLKIAKRLASQAAPQRPLQILVQLNIDLETSKGGISPEQFGPMCAAISELDNIVLRGLMLIPKPRTKSQDQREPFALAMQQLQKTNQRYGLSMDSLSMGMSSDLEAAIAEGSTMVRIGSDLFGARI